MRTRRESRFIDTLEPRQLMAVPTAPDGFSAMLVTPATPTVNGSALLTWRDNSTTENGFMIQRRIARKDGIWRKLTNVAGNVTSYTDTTLPGNGRSYAYRMRALSPEGDSERGYTDAINPMGPKSPEALSLSAPQTTQVRTSWAANVNDETGFTVQRRRRDADPWSSVAVRLPTSDIYMGWTDFNVTSPGSEWQYRVLSRRGTQWNASNVAFIRTPATNPTSNPPVGNLLARKAGNAVVLEWTDTTLYETGYAVQRRVVGMTDWGGYYGFLGINSTQFYDANVTPGVTYEYNVLVDGEGFTSPDAIVSIRA
jgi:hypothetical protein